MNRIAFSILALLLYITCSAQTQWTLQDCIDYGLKNNYSVKKSLLDLEASKVYLNTTTKSILPSVNAQIGQNIDFGRSMAANNEIVNQSQASTSFGVSMQMPLFEGLRVHHQKASDEHSVQAALYDLEQAKENITLNIMAYFLQVIMAKEVLEIAQEQKAIAEEQVKKIQKLVDGGKTSNSDLYNAQATLANDIVSITKANNNYQLAKLELAQLMNFKDVNSFDVVMPSESELININNSNLNLDNVLDRSLKARPGIKAAATRIEKGKRDILVSKSAYYPSLSLSASYGTGYYHVFNSTPANPAFGTQMNENSREVVSLTLNIPIFNKMRTKYSVQLSQLQLAHYEQASEEIKNNYIKEIQQAYYNATASKDNYFAAQQAVSATNTSYQYEEMKYNKGASSIYEYNESRLKHQKALSEEVQAKYDFIFRLKILEFYSN